MVATLLWPSQFPHCRQFITISPSLMMQALESSAWMFASAMLRTHSTILSCRSWMAARFGVRKHRPVGQLQPHQSHSDLDRGSPCEIAVTRHAFSRTCRWTIRRTLPKVIISFKWRACFANRLRARALDCTGSLPRKMLQQRRYCLVMVRSVG